MMDAYPFRAQPTGLVEVVIRLVGAGAAAPTVAMGPKGEPATGDNAGVVSGRTGVGIYTLAFPEKPGKFVAWKWSHGHTTPAVTTARWVNVDPDSMDGSDNTLNYIVVTPATDAVAAAAYELTTADVVCLFLYFKQTGKGA
jgi:hypothetical protein